MREPKVFIKEINGEFVIPSYQRGYKWTETQVEDLLNDVYEHSLKKEGDYCLQPLVISGNNIVDGQQRLTTIYIILKALGEEPEYSLSYATKMDSKEFLKNITTHTKPDETNPDAYFMSLAYLTAKKWFENKKELFPKETADEKLEELIVNFKDTLKERCYVIWYEKESEKSDAIDIFNRLNTGKIPLTNSELVRAIFLKDSNFSEDSIRTQLKIAGDWEDMEYELQDEYFWGFITTKDETTRYDTRIELILNLIAQKTDYSEKNEFFTFNYYYDQLKNVAKKELPTKVEELWEEISDCFDILKEWFNNTEYYHYIGFLIFSGVKLRDIFNSNKTANKKEFDGYLTGEIQKKLKGAEDIDNLEYGENNNDGLIQTILLFFNVQTCVKSSEKFSFKDYKKNKQSLEHIHAQNSEDLSPQEMKKWIGYHQSYLKEISLPENFENMTKKEEIEKLFKNCYTEVYKHSDIENMHALSNLALLDSGSNSALSNSIFPIKKKKIIDISSSKREYVLPCTRKVFNKEYSTEEDTGSVSWTQKDADSYLSAIKTTLNDFIPAQKGDK